MFLEEHAKESQNHRNVSILQCAQFSNVCSTKSSKNKSLGQVKECSHRNVNGLGRGRLNLVVFLFPLITNGFAAEGTEVE